MWACLGDMTQASCHEIAARLLTLLHSRKVTEPSSDIEDLIVAHLTSSSKVHTRHSLFAPLLQIDEDFHVMLAKEKKAKVHWVASVFPVLSIPPSLYFTSPSFTLLQILNLLKEIRGNYGPFRAFLPLLCVCQRGAHNSCFTLSCGGKIQHPCSF